MKRILLVNLILLLFYVNASAQISLLQFSTGFIEPLDIKNAGDNRLFIVERAGYIKIIDSAGVHRPGIFLDIHTIVETGYPEQGLLGLAFDPNYATTGYFYCYYCEKSTYEIHISRFSVSATNPDSAVASSEQILFKVYHHYQKNHDGGGIAFGPDGYLYFATGDGGGSNDVGNRSQNLDSLLGKMFRIDVSGGGAYSVPASNPFVGVSGRDEIWAYGLRNPWRWSFDRWTKDLWIGDVGQDAWEEIDFQPASSHGGENYGWHCYEGLVHTPLVSPQCSPTNVTYPVHVVGQATTSSCSITGGYVYRGARYSNMFGKYFFTDYCMSNIKYIIRDNSGAISVTDLGDLAAGTNSFVSFGENKWGELFAADLNGKIFRFQGQSCSPVAYLSNHDTLFVCGALSTTLHTPAGEGFHYSWTWSGGPIASDSSAIAITQGGTYTVTVLDTSACLATAPQVFVSFLTAPVVSFSGLDTLYCRFDPAVTLTPNPAGGTFSGHGISGNNFDPSVAGLGTHTIYYTYSDVNGCTESFSKSVRVDVCAGISDHSLVNISLFPNPNSGKFTLGFYAKKDEMLNMEVTDVLGQSVYKEALHVSSGAHQFNFSVPGIKKGVYSLNIYDSIGSTVKSFVVN